MEPSSLSSSSSSSEPEPRPVREEGETITFKTPIEEPIGEVGTEGPIGHDGEPGPSGPMGFEFPSSFEFIAPVTMRAKLQVSSVRDWDHPEGIPAPGQTIVMFPVGGDKVQHGYPADGSDDDNTFARWTPIGSLSLGIVNPDLIGKFKDGQKFYVDFTEAKGPRAAAAEPYEELPPLPPGGELAPATPQPQQYAHLELRALIMEELKRLGALLEKQGAITAEELAECAFKHIVARYL